jgi:membrane protein implicated in regulation of membrane protease activity
MRRPLRYSWWETPVGLIAIWILGDLFFSVAPKTAVTTAVLAFVAIVLMVALLWYSIFQRPN